MKITSYKVGDIVPYKNTRGNIRNAEITSFETVDNGKIWFNGIDTETKAKVWYPVHISQTLGEPSKQYRNEQRTNSDVFRHNKCAGTSHYNAE